MIASTTGAGKGSDRRNGRDGKRSLAVLVAFLSVALPLGAGASAQGLGPPPPRAPVLEAVGEGTVVRTPEVAILDVGVTVQAPTAREAMDRNAAIAQAVVKALRDLGLTAPDSLRTQAITLNPVQEGRPNERPRIIGYQAANRVEVRLPRVDQVGPALDAALKAGATDMGSLRFALADPRAAELAALEEAARDARARVEALARALGLRITRVVEVRSLDGQPRPMGETVMMARAAAPVPVEPGQLSIQARVLLRAEFQ